MRNLILTVVVTGGAFLLAACAGGGDQVHDDGGELGLKMFTQYCVLCHGDDGKKELNGAKDITISQLTFKERVELIKVGKGLMTPFDGIMSKEEMEAAAKYSMALEP